MEESSSTALDHSLLDAWFVEDEDVGVAKALADVVPGRRPDISARPYVERPLE